MLKQGKLRGEVAKYEDGFLSCCLWYPFEDTGAMEDVGICFDFPLDDIDDVIALLQRLKDVTPTEIEDCEIST